jgi:hypothetical protein
VGIGIALIAVALAPLDGRAQDGAIPSTLPGTWVFDGTPARGMQIVDAAFASGIATLPELFQGMARDRVRANMRPATRIAITVTGARYRISLAGEETKVIEGALGGPATTTNIDSDTTVTSGLAGGWLQLTYVGEGGMLQLFSTEPDGSRMHVDYTVTTDRFPAPVRYRLDYLRRGP